MTADDDKTRNSRQKQVYEIDGAVFSSLEGFFDEVSRKLIPDAIWGKNLDAFNDILRGGFGTPEDGFGLRWLNSNESREQLGFAETVRQLRRRLQVCHSSGRPLVIEQLRQAESRSGKTVFDWLVDIILIHCPGGAEQEDGTELELC
jgi:RNAse (barnase) inhibitor barstar